MTHLALIPPRPHLDLGITGTHLLLAHLCENEEYVQHYRERKMKGDFIILDNSAYEFGDAQAGMASLLAYGYYMQVNELVAPDAIMHERNTYAHTLNSVAFMSTGTGQLAWKRAGQPRIMVCPQVNPETQSIDSYERHAFLLMELWHQQAPYLIGHITLGVSKNMNKLHGGWLMLFREVITDLGKRYPIQVHILGMPKNLPTVKKVLTENSYIRSVDTALPFVCACYNQRMQPNDNGLPFRPDDYLDREFEPEEIGVALKNIEFMRQYFGLT